MEEKKEVQVDGGSSGKALYICMCSVNLLTLTVGMMLTWSSPVLIKLDSFGDENPFDKPITSTESSWITSLLSLGAVFGPFIGAFCADKIGRKFTLIGIAVPFIVAFAMLAFATNIILYYVARTLAGMGVGAYYTVAPMYIAEVSEDTNRGIMSAMMNVATCCGLLLSYCLGPYLSIMWLSLISAAIGCVFIVVFVFMPETPQFLIVNEKPLKAREALAWLRSTDRVDVEYLKMTAAIKSQASGSIGDLFGAKANIMALVVSVGLISFQQFSGINIILGYTQVIFAETGSSIPADISPIITGSAQLAAACVTPMVVDRLGRKILLVFSCIGMLISETSLGAYFYMSDHNKDVDALFWLPIASLITYVVTYNIGFGPLPWTVTAEVFPANVKALASSITASICWFFSFLLVYFFSNVTEAIGMSGAFWLFAGFNIVATIFTVVVVPETKGKTIEEIQLILS